jgi:hypothetical protein
MSRKLSASRRWTVIEEIKAAEWDHMAAVDMEVRLAKS